MALVKVIMMACIFSWEKRSNSKILVYLMPMTTSLFVTDGNQNLRNNWQIVPFILLKCCLFRNYLRIIR